MVICILPKLWFVLSWVIYELVFRLLIPQHLADYQTPGKSSPIQDHSNDCRQKSWSIDRICFSSLGITSKDLNVVIINQIIFHISPREFLWFYYTFLFNQVQLYLSFRICQTWLPSRMQIFLLWMQYFVVYRTEQPRFLDNSLPSHDVAD